MAGMICSESGTVPRLGSLRSSSTEEDGMSFGKGALLWLVGIPLPIILLLAPVLALRADEGHPRGLMNWGHVVRNDAVAISITFVAAVSILRYGCFHRCYKPQA
jgi:hypothetical protein